MSESYERSYYEIALTSGQAAMGIALLLACVLASFFAGLWVARQQSPAATVELSAAAGDEQDGRAVEGAGDTAVEGPAAADIRPAPTASPARPADERRRRSAGAEPQAATSAIPARDQRAESGTPSQGPSGASPSSDQPKILTASSNAPPATAEPAPQTPRAQVERRERGAPPEPAPGLPVIQVLSSSSRDQAEALVKKLRTGGYPAFVSPAEVNGTTKYRVRVGPYADRATAEQKADEIKRLFRRDTWITTT